MICPSSRSRVKQSELCSQLDFFAKSLRSDGGFDTLNWDGTAMPRGPQELHTTARQVHSFALGHAYGYAGSASITDAGHGGYVWSVDEAGISDGTKLAYGHVFVLLAKASAATPEDVISFLCGLSKVSYKSGS